MSVEREVFFCDCGYTEHMLLVSHFFWCEGFPAEFCLEPHLSKKPLRKRLAYVWRYLLGHQSRHGAFDTIILHKDDVQRLRASCDRFLEEENNQ